MRRVTLSFDNGPDENVTPRVLDLLQKYKIRTTFFVIGQKIANSTCRKIMERAVEEGHWIGNHTFTHDVPLGQQQDAAAPFSEIGRTQELIGSLAHAAKWFRPNGAKGNLDNRLLSQAALKMLRDEHYSCVLWSCVPGDLWDNNDWVEKSFQEIDANPWGLLVLHDIARGCIVRLDEFLERLASSEIKIEQQFPERYVPIFQGGVVAPIERFVT